MDKTFKVLITETLSRVVEVQAKDAAEAYEIVDDQYQRGEIELDARDNADYDVEVL